MNNLMELIQQNRTITETELMQMLQKDEPLYQQFDLSPEDVETLEYLAFELFQQGKLNDALTMFQGLDALGATSDFVQNAIGSIFAQQGDLPQALVHFSKAIDLNPQDITALTNRGELYLRLNQLEEAVGDLRKVIELDPDETDAVTTRAKFLVLLTHDKITKL